MAADKAVGPHILIVGLAIGGLPPLQDEHKYIEGHLGEWILSNVQSTLIFHRREGILLPSLILNNIT